MEMEFLVPITMGLGFFTMIGWVTHVIVDGRRRRERLKVFTEFHSKLIDRMGSAKDFGDFLQSDGGQRFLATISTERGGPQAAILRSLHTGVIMFTLGLGLLLLSRLDLWGREGYAFLLLTGVVVESLAIGFLLSAGLSWRLSRAIGLVTPGEHGLPDAAGR